MNTILILDDIRSAQNVGALFRTADAAGIEQLYLCGITPTPIDRFGRPNAAVVKTALGAEQSVRWEYVERISLLIERLKKQGVLIIAIEQDSAAVDYKQVVVREPVAFVLGNEVYGVQHQVLQSAEIIACIPMHGNKESLNVSVAGGIALFRMLNR